MKKKLRKRIEIELRRLVEQGAAPGFQLCLGYRQKCLGVFSVGLRSLKTRRPITEASWFDLSSLTKIISTTSILMFDLQNKLISSLDQNLQTWFPFFQSELKDVSLRELLNHRSGLPPIFEEVSEISDAREERLKFFLRRVDEIYPHTSADRGSEIYSDVGFMLLGLILEQIHGKRLSEVFKAFFQENMEMRYGPVEHPWERLSRIFPLPNTVPSMSLTDPGVWLMGEVQDPRAQWLGGDAGHAGLFGTAKAVDDWAQEIFSSYHGKSTLFSDKMTRSFIDFEKRQGRFLNGFDTPTGTKLKASQAGSFDPQSTVGHLGYSGCSFWMDIEKGYRVTLLSHRHVPEADVEKLSELRPAFHDWLLKDVFASL